MRRHCSPAQSLAKKRRALGLTQHQLSELTNIPVARIVFAETSRTDLTPDELDRIRDAFKSRMRQVRELVA